MMKPRAKTIQKVKEEILAYFQTLAEYWEKQHGTCKYKLNGLIFSILVMFDGESGLPAMDIVIRPHEDDKEYDKRYGNNWYPDGLILEEGDLHEKWNDYRI